MLSRRFTSLRMPASLRVLASLIAVACIAAAAVADRPNVILLMGDDHGWEETGYTGHPYLHTPVLDEMAATGLRFERFYAGHPNCSPTRASFLTGRHPNRMGTFAPGWSIRPQEITIAHLLSDAGYRCAHFGKWHVGAVKAGGPVNPGAMGFHEWLSHDNFFELDPPLSRSGAPPEVFPGESSEVLIEETIRFIRRTREREQPFLAVVWYGSPHEPYSGLPDDLALYDELPAKYSEKRVRLTSNETGMPVTRPQGDVLRERYAEITAMDRSIGTLRDFLRDAGLRDNTLLFYCGDNGTSADGLLRSPHRGKKSEIYEGGTLVPGLIEWPARIPQPRSTKFRAGTSDLLPTLAAIVGESPPDRPLDGVDLTPVFDGDVDRRSQPLHFWMFDTSGYAKANPEPTIDPALQVGTMPLVKLMAGKATRDFVNYRHARTLESHYRGDRSIIDGDWKLVIREGRLGRPQYELFDLGVDPGETTNLARRHADRVTDMAGRMREWQTGVLRSLGEADY